MAKHKPINLHTGGEGERESEGGMSGSPRNEEDGREQKDGCNGFSVQTLFCVVCRSFVICYPAKNNIKTGKVTVRGSAISDLRKSRSGRVEVGMPLAGQLSR